MPKLGYKGPDSYDPRDKPLMRAKLRVEETPPREASIAHLVPRILDQGDIGSCVVHAFALGVQMCERRNAQRQGRTEIPELTSRLFGYFNSRSQHGDIDNDSGTHIRLTIKQANRLGRPPEHVWPYDLSDLSSTHPKWRQRPPLDAYRHAATDRAAKYRRIFEEGSARFDPIRRAIAFAEQPVIFGTLVGETLARSRDGSLIFQPDPAKERILGGHAMLIVGYDEGGVWVANSWGTGSGENGYLHLDWSYIGWDETRDLWAIDL